MGDVVPSISPETPKLKETIEADLQAAQEDAAKGLTTEKEGKKEGEKEKKEEEEKPANAWSTAADTLEGFIADKEWAKNSKVLPAVITALRFFGDNYDYLPGKYAERLLADEGMQFGEESKKAVLAALEKPGEEKGNLQEVATIVRGLTANAAEKAENKSFLAMSYALFGRRVAGDVDEFLMMLMNVDHPTLKDEKGEPMRICTLQTQIEFAMQAKLVPGSVFVLANNPLKGKMKDLKGVQGKFTAYVNKHGKLVHWNGESGWQELDPKQIGFGKGNDYYLLAAAVPNASLKEGEEETKEGKKEGKEEKEEKPTEPKVEELPEKK